jgi:hypothetical protein
VATHRISRSTPGSAALPVVGAGLTAAVLALLVAAIALTAATGDLTAVSYGASLFLPAVVLVVGAILTWKRPSNPIGWLVLATALVLVLVHVARLYAVLDYHLHQNGLPLGPAAVFVGDTFWLYASVFLPIIILLFPEGQVPSRRWRAALAVYLVSCGLVMATFYVQEVVILRGTFRIDPVSGQSIATVSLHGIVGSIGIISDIAALAIPLFALACVVRVVGSWRGADGDTRQQLKWLMTGAAFAVAGALLNLVSNSQLTSATADVTAVVSNLMAAVLPVCIGVAVLRYRLYEIDRLVSRTITYALLTAALAGVFVATVLLTTGVLPLSSPVGVAASTLAAAALFSPLRRKLQRLVDQRFNRVHYNAEALLSDFTARLRGAVDPETVETGLLAAVSQAVAPAHASIWLSTPTRQTPVG